MTVAVRRAIREHLRDFIAIGALLVIGPAHDRLHPLPAAAAVPVLDPVPRRRPLRAQGRALDRPGRHARPGPDGEHRRGQGRRHLRRRARGGPRGRHDADRAEVRAADPHRRDRAPAPAHRPAGHDDGDRPGHDGPSRWPTGRRSRSPRPSRTSSPTRSSPSLDGDTRAYLQLLLQGGAARASAVAASSSRPTCGASSRSAATSPRSARRSRSAGSNIAQVDHQLQAAQRGRSARNDIRLADWVDSQNGALGAFANQEAGAPRVAAGAAADARATTRRALDEQRRALEGARARPRRP